ncbi:MAG: Lrp/AsnC family transcriptional regulator [Synergistes sp.]|nr:Lrp/AsnC family transcriptional regulator [Synergistes sp.]
MQNLKLLDEIGRNIVKILQENGRVSFNELGKRVGLSSPAVAERVRRLEDAGVISGYRAVVDYGKLGYTIVAYIRLAIPVSLLAQADEMSKKLPEVLECHHLTGSDGVIIKVAAISVSHLEEIITKLGCWGMSTTSIVLSSPVTSRVIDPVTNTSKHRMGRSIGEDDEAEDIETEAEEIDE